MKEEGINSTDHSEDANNSIGYQNSLSPEYNLPSIKTRYLSSLIDILVIVGLALFTTELFERLGTVPDYIRLIAFVVIFLLYEPILVSMGCTIGQWLMQIRVRQFKSQRKRIAFLHALFRSIIKAGLGWVSFLSITFDINRRALHDFASGSIVLDTVTNTSSIQQSVS